MRVAIVHDWLTTYAGAERVLEALLQLFPQAELYTVVDFMRAPERRFLRDRQVHTSFVQHLPFARSKYRAYLPLMPLAVEQFDLSGFDLVISSSHAVAKGVLTGPDQVHICYCHSPMRYAWDLQHSYLRESGLSRGARGWLARYLLHRVRLWDYRTAAGVDAFVANSAYIARRIEKVYRREATVIYPPVDIDFFEPGSTRDGFYLTASRFVPYKRVDLIVEAFGRMPDRRLMVIGTGPDESRLRAIASANVHFLGYQPNEVLRDYLQRARAFVFAAEEDFGILPVEAQACGTPVIAYGRGGTRDTVRDLSADQPTGVLFQEQTAEAIVRGVREFEEKIPPISVAACRTNALRFAPAQFRKRMETLVSEQLTQRASARQAPRERQSHSSSA